MLQGDWSSDVCSSDLLPRIGFVIISIIGCKAIPFSFLGRIIFNSYRYLIWKDFSLYQSHFSISLSLIDNVFGLFHSIEFKNWLNLVCLSLIIFLIKIEIFYILFQMYYL